MLIIQLQSTDKRLPKLREEMERTTQERHMSTDRFAAGKSADGLVDHRLEDRCRQVFLGSSLVDEGLDVRLREYTAARSDGVERLIIFGILIQTGRVCL